LQTLLKQEQDRIRERNKEIEDGVFAAINDPRRPLQPPKIEEVPPQINFAPLDNASTALTKAAERYRKAAASAHPDLARPQALARQRGRRRVGEGSVGAR